MYVAMPCPTTTTPEPTPDIDPDELPDEELNRAPVANNDEFSERFGWLLSGNLFEDNGNGIDKGADNDVILITGIGGQAVVFDTAMVLTSGATVTGSSMLSMRICPTTVLLWNNWRETCFQNALASRF